MSGRVAFPTPNDSINHLLAGLLSNVIEILANHFVGMYLYGSLAMGDFDENSDIDFLVVTDDEIADNLFQALRDMHARIAAMDSRWGTELEGSYVSRGALVRYDPSNARHPQIERGCGKNLEIARQGTFGIVQRYVLRERGIVLAGPLLKTLIAPISPNDLRRAIVAELRGWAMPMLDRHVPFESRGYQSYTVLTLCRILYTLNYGDIASKPDAAKWATTFDKRWAPLIERAWTGRQNPQWTPEPGDVNETIEMIRYALDKLWRFEMEHGS